MARLASPCAKLAIRCASRCQEFGGSRKAGRKALGRGRKRGPQPQRCSRAERWCYGVGLTLPATPWGRNGARGRSGGATESPARTLGRLARPQRCSRAERWCYSANEVPAWHFIGFWPESVSPPGRTGPCQRSGDSSKPATARARHSGGASWWQGCNCSGWRRLAALLPCSLSGRVRGVAGRRQAGGGKHSFFIG